MRSSIVQIHNTRRKAMVEKLLRTSAVLLCLVLISVPVCADVTGNWDVLGTVKVVISVKGEGSLRSTEQAYDYFVFGDNGSSFSTLDVPSDAATWSYFNKKKFVINVDNGFVEEYFATGVEQMLSYEGYYVDVNYITVTKNTFVGTENTRKNTIRGKWTLHFEGSLYDYGSDRDYVMKVKATIPFAGARSSDTFENVSVQVSETSNEEITGKLMEQIFSQLKKVILTDMPIQ
jgi:hypothetical protein